MKHLENLEPTKNEIKLFYEYGFYLIESVLPSIEEPGYRMYCFIEGIDDVKKKAILHNTFPTTLEVNDVEIVYSKCIYLDYQVHTANLKCELDRKGLIVIEEIMRELGFE